uniref:Cadherin domain-containing protein n=1 Tax=Anopheles farauti TaxID=69004 RepID=A0A182QEN7_9DIPT
MLVFVITASGVFPRVPCTGSAGSAMGSAKYSTFRGLRLIVITTLLLVPCSVFAQDLECSSPTLPTFNGLFPIGPEISTTVGAGYTLAQHEVSNILSVTVNPLGPDLPVYINADIADGKLTITTNEQFANYEKLDDKLLFIHTIVFICRSGAEHEMTFRQVIKEENNHVPLFSQQTYNIQVPLPLPREFNIQQFVAGGKGIVANDYDITKNVVTFSLAENDYFSVTSTSGASRTEFIANLVTKQTLTKIQPPITIQITAQDEWDPPKSSQATLVISGDPVIVFIAPPAFEQSLYRVSYKIGDNFTPLRMNLLADTYDSSVSYEASDEDAEYLTLTPTSDRAGVTVTLRTGAQIDPDRKLLSAIVIASRTGADSAGRTALVVELTREPIIVPSFEAPLYTGTIDRNRAITLEIIRLIPSTSDSSVRVQVTGDDARYFTVAFVNNEVLVVASTALSEAVLKDKNFFLLTVQATKPDVGVGETLVVLSVQKDTSIKSHFERSVYEGTITEGGVLILPTVRISPDSYVEGLAFGYTGDVDLLSASSTETSGIITITATNVTPETLAGKTYLLLTVTGTLEDEQTAQAVIVVQVLRIPVPKFTEPLLEGELAERTLQLQIANVQLEQESLTADTKLNLVDDRYFFDIRQDPGTNDFKLYLRENVTRELLRGIDRLTLRVEATNPGSELAVCIVAIDVVRPEPPTFERLIYDGTIDETKQLTEEVVAMLASGATGETISYTLEGAEADVKLFLVEPLATPAAADGVRIKLRAPLSDEEFQSRDHFQLTLKASNAPSATDTLVPVVIYVKRAFVKIPKFEKPLYKSRIGPDLKLVPFESITVDRDSLVDTATVAVRYGDSDLFGVELQDGIVTIRLLKELDEASVRDVSRFEFVVECSNPDMASGYATAIVDVERTVAAQFTEPYYTGTVREDARAIQFEQRVALTPETSVSGTEYTIAGVDSALVRYETVPTDQRLSFFLRDDVTKEQLRLRSEIGFIVVANNPGSNAPASVSCTVKIVRDVKPSFSLPAYRGKIVEGQTSVDFGGSPIAWESNSITQATVFSIVETIPVSDLFEVKFASDGSTLDIVLRSDVRWDQVRSSGYYQIVLRATNPDSEMDQCTVVIDVENLPTVTPAFTKAIYRGSLQEGTKEVIFSAADTITVQADTITPTFRYAVGEGDAALFVVELVDSNKFRVALTDSISPGAIEGRDMLTFLITISNAYSADDTATVVVTIKLDDIIVPTFSKHQYSGRIVEGTDQLTLSEPISLNAGTFTENTDIGTGGSDAELFTVSRVGPLIELTAAGGSIDWSKLVSKRYLSLYIQANNPGSDATTAFVVIDIDRRTLPLFAQTSAHGYIEIGARNVLFLEGSELRIITTSVEPGYQWNLSGDDGQLFDATVVDGLFQFSLKPSLTEEQLASRVLLTFMVTLKNPNSDAIEATVVIDRHLPSQLFSKHTYTGSFSDDLRLDLVDAIELTQESFSTAILVTVVEANVDFLMVEQSGPSVQLKLSRPISLTDFQGLHMVHLVLAASVSDEIRSSCTIVLTVPESTPCLPLPPIVDCTSCYNCTTGGLEDDVPVFAYGNYRFQLRSDTSGMIGAVTASAKDPTAVVQHSLDVVDAYLNAQLSITPEGMLSIAQPILPNVYEFLVHATNVAAGKRTTAHVRLDVLNQYECTEGTKKVTVEHTLHVQHLDEERPHGTIFPAQLTQSCAYELISEHPTDGQLEPYFFINSETGWLASRSFDRENQTLFADMPIPQFKLVLRLKCDGNDDGADPPQEAVRRTLVKRSLVETNTINYAPDITVVSIIVDDINDNDPVFTQPTEAAGNAVHLGYPEPSLAAKLMLSELVIVEATDADEGLNALVRYSLSDSAQFTIDATTGSIYPTREALRESERVDLTVIATDRDGAVDGRSAQLPLRVLRLNEDHIALVTLATTDATNVSDVIEQINRQDDLQLKILRQAYIPEAEQSGARRKRQLLDSTNTMRLVVYALNDNGELLDTEDIRSAIRKAIPGFDTTAIVSFTSAVCATTNDGQPCPAKFEPSSNAGLIASTSVLGALLLITMAIASVLYVRYVRPLGKSSNGSNPSDIVQLENDFDPTPPATPPTLGMMKKEQPTIAPDDADDRKISINISGITMQESEDASTNNSRLARSLVERLDEEDEFGAARFEPATPEPISEPKNVKFNEIVERIEVQEHHSDEEEDYNSVYEERL